MKIFEQEVHVGKNVREEDRIIYSHRKKNKMKKQKYEKVWSFEEATGKWVLKIKQEKFVESKKR